MLNILICVLCSVAVSVFLKLVRKQDIAVDQAIAVNYVVAALCCGYFLRPDLGQWQNLLSGWPLFLALGVLLPSVFVIMGRSVAVAGIVKSDAAQRLSLFLPIAAAFLLFGETLSVNKAVGIALAFMALLALLYKDGGGKGGNNSAGAAALLLGVWAGYGVIDILFKQLSKSGQAFSATLLLAFVLAGVGMFGWLWWRKTRFNAASILGGLLLGCLNFANILFYIRAHQAYGSNPTLVFAGMNLGVITLGTLVGALVFKEKIHSVNAAGIALALMAIGCLFYLDTLRGILGV